MKALDWTEIESERRSGAEEQDSTWRLQTQHLLRAVTAQNDSAEEEQRRVGQRFGSRCPPDRPCGSREVMEESYETFEEELGPSRAEPPPQKPVRQIHRPEMYAPRRIREEMAPVFRQPRLEPKTLPREPSIPRPTFVPKTVIIQNPPEIETPWENVTLNRCLFVVITVLVLTSGFQRLHEALRGHGTLPGLGEEEDEVTVRRSSSLRNRLIPSEPETSLWEVMLQWLPDLDDEDDEDDEDDDDEEEPKRGRSKRGVSPRTSKLRNRPLLDKRLMKQRDGRLKDRRAKKLSDDETNKDKHEDKEEEEEAAAAREDEEDEGGEEETTPDTVTHVEEKKKKTQRG